MEAITEVDRVEEKQQHPLIKADRERWASFFADSKQLLSSTTSVSSFQDQLVLHLFPKDQYLLICKIT